MVLGNDIKIWLNPLKMEICTQVTDKELWSFLLETWKDDTCKFYKHPIPITSITDEFKIIWNTDWEIINKHNLI